MYEEVFSVSECEPSLFPFPSSCMLPVSKFSLLVAVLYWSFYKPKIIIVFKDTKNAVYLACSSTNPVVFRFPINILGYLL